MKKLILLISVLAISLGLFAASLNEGFESTTCPPDGWTIEYANPSYPSGNTMTHTTDQYYSGSRSFRFSSFSSGSPYDQYLITPELVVTEGDQTVSFWYRNHSYGSELFKVGWSSTGTATADFTWTDDITNSSTTWQQYSKTDLPIGTKYVAIHYYSNYQYYLYVDDFVGPEIYIPPTPPSPANIVSPTDAALNVALDASLNWSSGGGFPDGYYLSFGTVDPYTTILDEEDMEGDTSYEPQNLAYGTEYWWQVVPYNTYGNATACPTWSFTTMADPTQPLPYLQDFEAPTTLADINWSGTFSIMANHGTIGSNGLSCNLWSSATTAVATTPPIGPLAPDSEILFDYRYVNWSGYPATATPLVTGDQLQIQVSTDGVTFDTLHTIDMNNHVTSTSFAPVTVNVSAYSGNIFVRFNAARGTGDYYLDIDNVIVREVPLAPIISVTPDSWDFGTMLINTSASKEFTISNIGAGTLNVTTVNVTGTGFALAEAFTPVALLPFESASFTVNFNPLTANTYSGNIAINDNRALTNIPLTGEALDATIYADDLPHLENFDGVTVPALPVGWATVPGTTGSVGTQTSNASSLPNTLYMYSSGASSIAMVSLPPVSLSSTNLRIKFNGRSNFTAGGIVDIGSMTDINDPATFTLIGSRTLSTLTYQAYSVDLGTVNGVMNYAIRASYTPAYSILLDDITFEIPAALPPEPATLVWPLNGITTLLNPLLKWAPSATGEPATSYKVYMNDSGTFSESDLIYEGTDTQYQTADMSYGRTFYWKVLPTNTHGSDPTCPTWGFSTPGEYQSAEGFEPAWPPAGWSNIGSWSRGSTYKVEGTYSAYKAGSTTTQYVLSTPMVTIVNGSTLQFGAAGSTTSASLEVVYSEDRTTWTQIGNTITHTATYTFTPQVIDLSDLAGNNYYLGFRTGLTSGTNYIDHIIGPELTPVLPGVPTLTAPADAATNQSNYPSFTWTSPTTGGVPSGYNLYLDTVDGSTLYASNVTSPYVPTTALDWETIYYWTVKAFNNAGTGDAPAARSFTVMSDPTIYVSSETPWLVDFGTVTGDWPVANWTQLTGVYGVETPASGTQWYRDDWLNGASGNNAARINIYGTIRDGWLVTPPISIPADGYELKFDLGLTDNATSNPIDNPTGQPDDKFMVLVSDYPTMAGATPLRTWDNDSSEYVYNAISHTGSTVTLPLTGISGTKYFAFYGESTVTGGDNDLFVDNVLIRETIVAAPDPVTLTSPADGAENLSINGFNLTWTPAITGGNPTEYFVLMGTTNDPDNMEYLWEPGDVTTFNPTLAEIEPITFNYSETWYWTVIATNGDGDSEVPTPFSFTIMPDPRVLSLPYSQNFDGVPSSSMPEAWTGYINSTSSSAYVHTSTSYSVSTPNSMYLYTSGDANADLRLITPEILVPMNSIKLSFSARAGSVGPNLLVGTVDALDGTGTFNQIASIPLTAAHIVYTISFAEYLGTDQYICFKHGGGGTYRSIYIDNVYMEELVPNDMALNALTGPGFGLAGQLLSYTVEVLNNGTIEQSSYSVQLLSSPANTVLATLNVTEPIAAGATAQHTIDWTPTTADQYTIFAKVILTGDVNSLNDESATRTVDVFSSDSYIPFVGDPASTTTVNYLPFNMYYKNNVTETIYMPHEMQMATGTINGIVYQNNFVQDLTKPVRIWMKHTTENVNAAWLPFEDYTLVFEGDVHFPLGVNAVVIPLDTPFNYTGGNLAVRTYREFENEYWNSANHFYYTMDANYPNRVRYLNQDGTTPIDPTAPASTGTQTSYIVNTAFIVDPHTELVLTPPAVQIAMSGTNPQLSWNAVYGTYLYVIYGSDDPYDWSEATEVTTSNLIYTITSAPAKKFYKVAARSYNHEERTIGQVLNPASAIGFDNSAVRALPLIPEKGDKK